MNGPKESNIVKPTDSPPLGLIWQIMTLKPYTSVMPKQDKHSPIISFRYRLRVLYFYGALQWGQAIF